MKPDIRSSKGNPLGNRLVVGLAAGTVIGLVLFFVFTNISDLTAQSRIEENVKRLYSLIAPGSTVEVMSFEEQSGLYKVLLKVTASGTESFQEVHVTKDGRIMAPSESVILVDQSIENIERSRVFVDCLYDKGVRIVGVLDEGTNPQGAQATSLQLNLLGRIYSPKLYISCDGETAQQCIDSGISTVPSAIIGTAIEPGVKDVQWFEARTGCKMGA